MKRLPKEKIAEVIVVEGRDDLIAVKKAVDAQVIITQGLGLSPKTLALIQEAEKRCGLIVFTDPDGPGERIRRWITDAVPGAKHAFLPVAQAREEAKVGIEHASTEDIQEALRQVRSPGREQGSFTKEDMRNWKLEGHAEASWRRHALGERLGIGQANAKQFLQRLNHFALLREDVEKALQEIGEKR
ncbi:ribonuclease M5 [Heliorestis acidaminivorans]|uniref:Ribonuclease M5 n=1 Tax=Heliorestis acidaminivorans TaxID=553427 RepID=A0A6I0ERM5_9FIRM|nr:ribonuclease M5 [Heliorestis acidaminivorans]KAB2953019.1 ribonuclease M5 [Heliorestis acidaminivorans]